MAAKDTPTGNAVLMVFDIFCVLGGISAMCIAVLNPSKELSSYLFTLGLVVTTGYVRHLWLNPFTKELDDEMKSILAKINVKDES